jgi:hypothetical protein
VIAKVRPILVELIDASRYRRVIDRSSTRRCRGWAIERVKTEPGKGLLVIAVPDQPAEARPLLVIGAVVAKKIVGSHISIVRRRGDATTVTHPAALHSLLAAGRGGTRRTRAKAQRYRRERDQAREQVEAFANRIVVLDGLTRQMEERLREARKVTDLAARRGSR